LRPEPGALARSGTEAAEKGRKIAADDRRPELRFCEETGEPIGNSRLLFCPTARSGDGERVWKPYGE
jgi:RNA polymerase-binding transcription factor DksA